MATADEIIARVLVRCGWGSSNNPVSDAEILAFADDEITSTLLPQLHSTQGDWHLTRADKALVADQALYRMPKRMWGPIKDLQLVPPDGGKERSLRLVNIEELGHFPAGSVGSGDERFLGYLDGDYIGLYPTPTAVDTTWSLRFIYYRRPNQLCLQTAARRISLASSPATSFVLTNTITGFDGQRLDFIGSGASHQVLAEDQVCTSVLGTIMSMAAVVPGSIETDDWVALSGYTPVAPIPDHMVPQLTQLVAAHCMNAHGDEAGFRRNAAMAGAAEKRALPTISPRQEAEPVVIRPRNSPFMRWRG